MGKGRYLKAAERACARKARFETHLAAESFVEGRYRAYRCVVCGAYHLTSGKGDRPEAPEPPRREPPGPKLGDLDWSAVLDPPKKAVAPLEAVSDEVPPPTEQPREIVGRCVSGPGRDGRVAMIVEGRLVKSRPVPREWREELREGTEVIVEGRPPKIARILRR